MAEGVGAVGGIVGLLGLVDGHREAIDYDLLTLGLDLTDLGSERLDWQRLKAIVTYLPATSALARSVHGDKAAWSDTEHMLAAAVDALHDGNWQRGGGKGRRPKKLPRPGEEDRKQHRRFGTAKMSLDEARDYFARINRAPAPVAAVCTEHDCGRAPRARGLCAKHYKRWWRQTRGTQ